jgi:zinc transport system substrate-binding protein
MVLMTVSPRLAAGAALGALLLTGCGAEGGSASTDGVSVAAAAYPFAYVVERVGGDHADVDNLTSPGAEPHDVELTPQQVAAVGEADLVVYQDSFQPSVDDAVDQSGLPDDARLDVADVVPLQDTGARTEDGDESALDPHVWLDPVSMVAIAEAVADRLAEVDPDHERAYRSNAAALVDDLHALDHDFARGLTGCARTTVVTAHDAFRYLAARYHLEMVPISGIDPAHEPLPAQQAEIADTVAADGITTIFTEELVSPAVAQSIADETGATTATLSPIEGLSDGTADEDYLSLMRANLHALEEANGCS